MCRSTCLLAFVILIGHSAATRSQVKDPKASKLPAGVYAVMRDSLDAKEVRPLMDGEVLIVHHHRYLRKDAKQPPRFLVVRSAPDVQLDLNAPPQAVKEGEEVVRILLKLRPNAATALERLTSERVGRPLTIVIGGEVVTMHKIREVIKGGDVQITNCAAGAANYLLEQLQAHHKKSISEK